MEIKKETTVMVLTTDKKEIRKGDYVVFWSLAAGITTTVILIKY